MAVDPTPAPDPAMVEAVARRVLELLQQESLDAPADQGCRAAVESANARRRTLGERELVTA